ncbi:MAG: isocitrate/isopropylmalate dehydrogenase family protein [Sandaracinaceae bacterium]|nr:isocitrate/isopropylmalate dehydrogenase family protein [Sandaracinaceae bacterium]
MAKHVVTLIPGDGIGPEVAAAVQEIVRAAGVDIQWELQEAGAATVSLKGTTLPDEVLDSIKKNKVALKGPIATPIGTGFRSVNVQIRKDLDLFASLRPVKSLPGVATPFTMAPAGKGGQPGGGAVDLVIVRENTEGMYTGIEHEIMPGVREAVKIVTEKASSRICEFAFTYAEKMGYPRVTVVHKANIMKKTDGLFLECGRAAARRHPNVECVEMIVDACAMNMVRNPNRLGVIVTLNLYGDILSDLAAGLVGGLGIVPGANIGLDAAVFEAVHGSAPDIAGKGLANPTALLQSAIMMLDHMNEHDCARKIERALRNVYERELARTGDLGGRSTTREFTDAIKSQLV